MVNNLFVASTYPNGEGLPNVLLAVRCKRIKSSTRSSKIKRERERDRERERERERER